MKKYHQEIVTRSIIKTQKLRFLLNEIGKDVMDIFRESDSMTKVRV